MKEFNGEFENIFNGLNPERSSKKKTPGLEECHNLEPLKDDYAVHAIIIDMNATGQDWNNTALPDYWEDHEDDDWTDDSDDDFEDI